MDYRNAPKRLAGQTRELVRKNTEKGLNPREISLLLGISTQAVYGHLHNLRRDGELPERETA